MSDQDTVRTGSSASLEIAQLPELDVGAAFMPAANLDEIFLSAHEHGPFARSARGLEVIGYRQCAALMRDKRLYADHMGLVEAMAFPEGPAKEFKKSMLLSHGRDEYRSRIRRALTRAIGPSVIENQRPMIRDLVQEILSGYAERKGTNLLREFAFGLPSSLFCLWFGAPVDDAPWVADISDRILKIFSFDTSFTPGIISAYDELFPYVQKHVEEALESPKDNLLGHFIAEQRAGLLSETELFQIVVMFNEASTDNTAHGIATAIGNLLGDQDRWRQLVENPGLIPAAINENMRLSSRINTLIRYAGEDVVFEGLAIPKGTALHFLLPAAHRDPAVFHDPLVYEPEREDAYNLLDFGGGIYTCLGKRVALMEIQEAVAAIVQKYPDAKVIDYSIDANPFANAVSELSVDLGV